MNAISSVKSEATTAAPRNEVTDHVVEAITARFANAEKPIVIVDACAGRFGMAGEVRKLVEGAGVRFFESESKAIFSVKADIFTLQLPVSSID
jgi:pyruvate decarboxylase